MLSSLLAFFFWTVSAWMLNILLKQVICRNAWFRVILWYCFFFWLCLKSQNYRLNGSFRQLVCWDFKPRIFLCHGNLYPTARHFFFLVVYWSSNFFLSSCYTSVSKAGETGGGLSHSVWTMQGPLFAPFSTRAGQHRLLSRFSSSVECRSK